MYLTPLGFKVKSFSSILKFYLGFILKSVLCVLECLRVFRLPVLNAKFPLLQFSLVWFLFVFLNMNAVCFCILWKHAWACVSARQISQAVVFVCRFLAVSSSFMGDVSIPVGLPPLSFWTWPFVLLFSDVVQGCICVVWCFTFYLLCVFIDITQAVRFVLKWLCIFCKLFQ